jgi:flagellar biosynthesis/type III secretory pathway protein FliH
MLVSEYSYEMDIAVQRAESEEKGVMRGRLEGRREGRLEGHREGRLEGRLEGQTEGSNNKGIQVFLNCKKRGMSDQDAQAIADISDELVKIALKDNEV